MKQYKIIIVLVLYLLALNLFGQDYGRLAQVKFAESRKTEKYEIIESVLQHDSEGMYVIKGKGKNFLKYPESYSIEHLDANLNRTKSIDLTLNVDKKRRKLEFCLFINQDIKLFSSWYDRDLEKKFFYVESIDKGSLTFQKDLKKIAEIDLKDVPMRHRRYNESFAKYNGREFIHLYSNVSSKILVYYEWPSIKHKAKSAYDFFVYDNKLNSIWNKKVELPYATDLFDWKDIKIDNLGGIHILGILFNEKHKEKVKGKPNYKYYVLSVFPGGNGIKEYPIELENMFLGSMNIMLNSEQNIICSGFYSRDKLNESAGTYFVSIDNKGRSVMERKATAFNKELFTKDNSIVSKDRQKQTFKKGKYLKLPKYSLNSILQTDDGNTVLIAEQSNKHVFHSMWRQRTTWSTTPSSVGMGRTTTTMSVGPSRSSAPRYYMGNILVVKLQADGSINWITEIPKKQDQNLKPKPLSFAHANANGALYFIFNDNPDNLISEKLSSKVHNCHPNFKSAVTLVEVNSNGVMRREKLFSAKDEQVLLFPKFNTQISNTEMIMFGGGKKMDKVVKVTF